MARIASVGIAQEGALADQGPDVDTTWQNEHAWSVHPSALSTAVGSWWGYAEADPTIVGILVGCVAAFAVAFVIVRVMRGHSSKAEPGPGERRRGGKWRS